MRVAHRKITAWIVSLALLFVALCPAFAHAASAWSGDASGWGEICTSQGLVRTGDAGAQPADDAGSSGTHARSNCLCCVSQQVVLALPTATHVLVPSGNSARVPSAAAWSTPHARIDWPPSRPRGPPFIS